MRQETHNIFQDGLNFDLNPITTPNNLLTDCVNGTFLTFNGNELVIQNDAGNILLNIENTNDTIPSYNSSTTYDINNKVAVQTGGKTLRYYICLKPNTTGITPSDDGINWKEYIIRLSDGFFPIGVKEYGGVLYIVSRRRVADIAVLYSNSVVYPKGKIVKDESIPIKYWESLDDNNSAALTESDSWLPLTNSLETYDKIEFGSFPSPERYTYDNGTSKNIDIDLVPHPEYPVDGDVIPNVLYSPKVINDIIFRPGEYVQFNQTPEQVLTNYLDYVSTPLETKFYKLKLYQQLTSGLLDLTEDIETAYTAFGGVEDFWILDSNFKYYCPFLYKGKLMISLELEPLISFRIVNFPELSFSNNEYTVTVDVEAEYNIGDNCMYIPSLIISTNLEGYISPTSPVYVSGEGVLSATLTFSGIPANLTNQIFKFTVTPYYEWLVGEGASTEDDIKYLPTQFTDQYILEGSMFLTNEVFDIDFPLSVARQYSIKNICSTEVEEQGYRIYNELYLTNNLGDFLNEGLELDETAHVVLLEGTTASEGNTVLGYFTKLSDGSISSVTWESGLSIEDDVKQAMATKLSTINVKVLDNTCLLVDLNLSVVGESNVSITVSQLGGTLSETKVGNNNTFSIIPDTPASIYVTPYNGFAYELIWDTVLITESTSYTYALIGKIVYATEDTMNFYVLFDSAQDIGIPGITIDYIDTTSNLPALQRTINGYLSPSNILGTYKNLFIKNTNPYVFETGGYAWFISYAFTTNLESPYVSYKNIQIPSDYVLYNDVVFRRRGNLTIKTT